VRKKIRELITSVLNFISDMFVCNHSVSSRCGPEAR